MIYSAIYDQVYQQHVLNLILMFLYSVVCDDVLNVYLLIYYRYYHYYYYLSMGLEWNQVNCYCGHLLTCCTSPG
jgi:hypothetical protein